MPKLFTKKENKIKLSDLREKAISPARDWRFILYAFFGWIILCFLVIGSIFFLLMKGDVSSSSESLSQDKITINRDRLLKAVEFIESRN